MTAINTFVRSKYRFGLVFEGLIPTVQEEYHKCFNLTMKALYKT